MQVVCNTSPLRYLITVGQSDLIQSLFGHILIPRGVEAELTHPSAPKVVRQWLAQRPAWIDVRDLVTPPELALLQHPTPARRKRFNWPSISMRIFSSWMSVQVVRSRPPGTSPSSAYLEFCWNPIDVEQSARQPTSSANCKPRAFGYPVACACNSRNKSHQ